MPAYYFAITGYHPGEKPDPAADTIIAIQYQKIDLTSGEAGLHALVEGTIGKVKDFFVFRSQFVQKTGTTTVTTTT